MSRNPASKKPEPVHPKFHLLKACLAAQRRTIQGFCRQLPASMRHVQFVCTGERQGSRALLAAIRRELGEPGWNYAIGASDRLPESSTVEARP